MTGSPDISLHNILYTICTPKVTSDLPYTIVYELHLFFNHLEKSS